MERPTVRTEALILTANQARRLAFALAEPECHEPAARWLVKAEIRWLAAALCNAEDIRVTPENRQARNHRPRRRAFLEPKSFSS